MTIQPNLTYPKRPAVQWLIAISITTLGCSGKTSQSRTDAAANPESDDANASVQTAAQSNPITGTNLVSAKVLESTSADGLAKLFSVEGTTNHDEKIEISAKNSSRLRVIRIEWKFSGEIGCQHAGAFAYRPRCQLPGGSGTTVIRVSANVITDRDPNGIPTEVIDSELKPVSHSSQGRIFLILLSQSTMNPSGFTGSMAATSFSMVDDACESAFSPIYPGNFVFKALVKPEASTWKTRFTTGSKPAPDIVSFEEGSSSPQPNVAFNRDMFVSQSSGPPQALMNAGTDFVVGLNARQNELTVDAPRTPMLSSGKIWFGNGCADWSTTSTGVESGTALMAHPKAQLGGAVGYSSMESCSNTYKIACLAIEN